MKRKKIEKQRTDCGQFSDTLLPIYRHKIYKIVLTKVKQLKLKEKRDFHHCFFFLLRFYETNFGKPGKNVAITQWLWESFKFGAVT